MVKVLASDLPECLPLWTGEADELADTNTDLPEWQLDMVRALSALPVGSVAFVGLDDTFRVVRV